MKYQCVVCKHAFVVGEDIYNRTISYVCIPCYDKYKDPVEPTKEKELERLPLEHEDHEE